MIVECTAEAAAAYPTVVARAARQLTGHGLDAAATTAVRETQPTLIRAGMAGVTKQVAISTLDPIRGAAHTVIPFRWVATGASGELFPSLEANLTLRPASETSTEISVIGSYQPPFGKAGVIADHLLLRRVAEHTLARFLGQLLEAVTTQPPVEADPAPTHPVLGLEATHDRTKRLDRPISPRS